jgi:transcriptional regulator with XRE-family HTH domain
MCPMRFVKFGIFTLITIVFYSSAGYSCAQEILGASQNENTFGLHLKDHLAKRGLSYAQAADLVGISKGYMSLLIQGRRRAPRPVTLARMIDKLGMPEERTWKITGYSSAPSLSGFTLRTRGGGTKPNFLREGRTIHDAIVADAISGSRERVLETRTPLSTWGIDNEGALFFYLNADGMARIELTWDAKQKRLFFPTAVGYTATVNDHTVAQGRLDLSNDNLNISSTWDLGSCFAGNARNVGVAINFRVWDEASAPEEKGTLGMGISRNLVGNVRHE